MTARRSPSPARSGRLGERCDCLALVSFEHPLVIEAIEAVREQGVHVVSLLTELSTRQSGAYVGTDNHEVGRTAGWLIAHGSASTGGSGGGAARRAPVSRARTTGGRGAQLL
jgi:LacI family transcriptional regulator